MEKILKEIIWKAPEFKYYPKSVAWYGLSAAISVLLILFAVWQKNLLFGIFVIIAELTLISWANRQPKTLEFKIDKKGVAIGQIKFYQYEELTGFHIHDDLRGGLELILKTKSKLNPYVRINIIDKDIPEMKSFLKQFIPEIEYKESLSEDINRIIKF